MALNGSPAAYQTSALTTDTLLRRAILFVGMLMSGGNLILPRVGLLVFLVLLVLVARGPQMGMRRDLVPALFLILLIFVISIVGASTFDLASTAVRFGSFFAALLLLGQYGGRPAVTFGDDIFALGKFFAVQSIATPFLALFVPNLFFKFIVQGTTYETFFLVFTYHELIEGLSILKRPDGFFWEPGVFNIYLNLFLFVALFIRRNLRWSLVGLVAVLATQSTTGVVLGVALVVIGGFRSISQFPVAARIFAVFILPLAIAPLIVLAYTNVDSKVSGQARGSFWSRQYDLVTGLNVAMEHPLVGIGFNYQDYFDAAVRSGYRASQLDLSAALERSNSNGIVTLMFSVGLPLSFLMLTLLFLQCMLPHRWVVAMLLFASMLSQALLTTPFFMMLLFSGTLNLRLRRSYNGRNLALPGLSAAGASRQANAPI